MTKEHIRPLAEEINERIEDVTDLQYLKKYACPKYQHKREWYLECIDCKTKNKCKAGKQAIFLMNNSTEPAKKETKPMTPQEIQDKKKREEVENIFKRPDPVKYLLETSPNIKPQSIYQRVNLWRKNYPDLQEKYQMIEKVRFLWTKPYDSMKVPKILEELYPEANSGEQSAKEPEKQKIKSTEKKEPEVSYTDIAPNSKIFTVEPDMAEDVVTFDVASMHPTSIISEKKFSADNSDDCISLEDFLQETSDSEEDDIHAEKEAEEVSAPKAIQDAAGSSKDLKSMAELLKKLEKDIQQYEAKIKETRNQIEAIKTVQKLMGGG